MLILTVFLKILLIIFVLLLMLLFIRFNYALKVRINEEMTGMVISKWLFGLLKIEVFKAGVKPQVKVYLSRLCIYSSKMKFTKKKSKKIKTPFEFPEKEFIIDMLVLIKEVFNVIKPTTFIVRGSYGFEDPAITGITSATICMMQQNIPSCKIFLTPIFEDEIIDIEIEIAGNIKAFIVVYFVIKFIFKKEVRNIIFKKRFRTETV
jgi:hypothetical protein